MRQQTEADAVHKYEGLCCMLLSYDKVNVFHYMSEFSLCNGEIGLFCSGGFFGYT